MEANHGMEELNLLGKKEVLKKINEFRRLVEYRE
jgi:hypothetical protein